MATVFLYAITLFFHCLCSLLIRLPQILKCLFTGASRDPNGPAIKPTVWQDPLIAWLFLSIVFVLWFQWSLGGSMKEIWTCLGAWFGFTAFCRFLCSDIVSHKKEVKK